MIEKNVEAAIMTAIQNLNLPDLDIVGLWQPSATGVVKGTEKSDSTAALVVKIPPKSFDTFGICEVQLEADLVLTVRIEQDSTGEKLVQYVEPINNLLERWNMVTEQEDLEDLETDDFSVGGIHVNGGTGPTFDAQSRCWTVTFSLTIRGLLKHDHD